MWFFAGGAALVLILSIAMGRAAARRHQTRQNRSMRDHLNRISQRPEDV